MRLLGRTALVALLVSGPTIAMAVSILSVKSNPPTGQITRVFPDERTFLLNVPDEYEHGTPHALVLSYHGAGGNSSNQERLTQLADPSLRLNGLPILSAFPQGVNNTDYDMTNIWQGAPYANASVDDVQFTKCIVADIGQNYTIDPRRIYISGKSNGGGFTNLAACHPELSKLFAAFAPVSAALYPNTGGFGGLLCNPARAVPIVNSHGLEDTTAPYRGRSPKACGNGPLPDIDAWRQGWADRNAAKACADESGGSAAGNGTMSPSFDDVTNTTWVGKGWEIVGLTDAKLGHSWPTTAALDLSGAPNNSASFNFTREVMIPFFESHVLPEEYVGWW